MEYKDQKQGPTLRYFKTPCDFCEIALEEAVALFPSDAKLKLLLSNKIFGSEFRFDIPCIFTGMLPRDAWMLLRDCDKGDIFYCPGA